jgi:hypothetical protein
MVVVVAIVVAVVKSVVAVALTEGEIAVVAAVLVVMVVCSSVAVEKQEETFSDDEWMNCSHQLLERVLAEAVTISSAAAKKFKISTW